MITDIEIGCVAGKEGKLRDDGWRGLPATLHRISGDFDEQGLVEKITMRVAKVIMGVAEPFRAFIESARGI